MVLIFFLRKYIGTYIAFPFYLIHSYLGGKKELAIFIFGFERFTLPCPAALFLPHFSTNEQYFSLIEFQYKPNFSETNV